MNDTNINTNTNTNLKALEALQMSSALDLFRKVCLLGSARILRKVWDT